METPSNFKSGDIVQLKSGGPKMTVLKLDEGGWLDCAWFAGSKHERKRFTPESLQHVGSEEKNAQ